MNASSAKCPGTGSSAVIAALCVFLLDAFSARPGSCATAAAAAAARPVPHRIVSLVPSVTETLFALGLADRVVGVSTDSDVPVQAVALPKVGTFTAPVAEAIVVLRPDLVLTSPSPGNQSAVNALQRAGINVAVIGGDGGIDEARKGMLDVARAAGEEARGAGLVARLDAELETVRAAVAGRERPVVAVAVGRDPLVLAGPSSYLGELVVVAGGANVAAAVGGRWPRVGLEFLVQQRPEVLLDLSISMEPGDSPAPGDQAAVLERWADLGPVPAVSSRRVHRADRLWASALLRPGPRLADAARFLALTLHPRLALPPSALRPLEDAK